MNFPEHPESQLPPGPPGLTPVAPAPEPEPPPAQQLLNVGQGDRRLFNYGVVAVLGLSAYLAYQWSGDDIIHLYQGLAIFMLSTVPALQWARRGEASFPLMGAFLLTTLNTYAIPLLTGHQSLRLYPDDVITTTANVVIVYQLAAIFTYGMVRGHPKTTKFWTVEVISEEFGRFLSYGMIATTVYTFFSVFYHEELFGRLPRETEGIFRAVFFGLGIICTFITCRRWGQGILQRHERTSFLLNLVLQFLILSSSLYLISGISMIVLALLGYISGSRRIPVIALCIVVPVVAVLHHGKTPMREKYWGGNRVGDIVLGNIVQVYGEWIGYGLQRDEEEQRNSTTKLLERTSLFHILCLVVDATPARQDFLYGETYRHIPGQFIPRFFWPDKPVGHISTYYLSQYYGLQSEEATRTTTIGFGMLSEAYANFGYLGAIILGVLFGWAFKKISIATRHSPMLSYGGLLLVILMAWSFQTELTLSIWISSLFQACVVVIGIPLLVRSFLN
jgi:hypothetical protein